MKRRTKVILIAIGVIALIAGAAFAKPSGKMKGPGKDEMLKFSEELKLTDVQIQKLEDIRYDVAMKNIDRRASIEKAELEMSKLLDADKLDKKKILSQAEKIAQLKNEIELAQLGGMLDAADVLTPEQFKQFKELRRENSEERMDKPPREGPMHPRMQPEPDNDK